MKVFKVILEFIQTVINSIRFEKREFVKRILKKFKK